MKEPMNSTDTKYAPFKCPVCNGFGTVSFKKIKCHACKGKGLVLVDQETGEIYERPRMDKTA